MINRGLFLLFLMAVSAQIQSMEIEGEGGGVGVNIDLGLSEYQEIGNGTAEQMENTLFDDVPGDHGWLVSLIDEELSNNPAISVKPSQRSGGEEGTNQRLRIMGSVLVQVLKKTNEEKNKNAQEVDHQKGKVREKKEQLQSEEKKSFWSILAAVGTTVGGAVAAVWAGVETATSSEQVPVVCNYVVDVICNCTSATF